MKNKTVIIIAGPTAVGKTRVAIDLAKHFQTEIISADSRQCYRELNIGVARPSESELQEVPHHFIAAHSITENINAGFFEQYALEKTKEIFREKDVVIMCGGTGLYIKAFCEGMDEIPAASAETRNRIIEQYKQHGLAWLQETVKEKDPVFFQTGENQNPQRLMRALEVMEETGQSILAFRTGKKPERDFSILRIGLELPKEELQRNIELRAQAMYAAGLVEEVKNLQPFRAYNALKTVGYNEVFDFLDGHTTRAGSMESVKTHTRQYAKRQLTWFKKDTAMQWFSPSAAAILASIKV